MFSACAGVSSIASHTLAKRFLLIDLAPLTNPGNAAPPGSDPLCSFSASSSGSNAARKRHHRTSPHTALSRGIDPNFPHPSANRIHRLPVVGLAPMLDLLELMSRLTPSRLWKRMQIVECAASELDRLEINH